MGPGPARAGPGPNCGARACRAGGGAAAARLCLDLRLLGPAEAVGQDRDGLDLDLHPGHRQLVHPDERARRAGSPKNAWRSGLIKGRLSTSVR